MSDTEEEGDVCITCGEQPCNGIAYSKRIQQKSLTLYTVDDNGAKLDYLGNPVDNAHLRKMLFKIFIEMKYGILGKGNRVPILECIIVGIGSMFPDSWHSCMGFKEA